MHGTSRMTFSATPPPPPLIYQTTMHLLLLGIDDEDEIMDIMINTLVRGQGDSMYWLTQDENKLFIMDSVSASARCARPVYLQQHITTSLKDACTS